MERESFLKTYDVTLEVKGPVFIGSGNQMSSQEYIGMKNRIIVPDMKKMMVSLCRLELQDEYEKFVLQSYDKDLKSWLIKQNITTETMEKWKKYELELGPLDLNKQSRPKISEFIKDGYGLPFVPGTSLKGMLRTIILGYNIQKNPNLYADFKVKNERSVYKYEKDYLNAKTEELENMSFCRLNRKKTEKYDAVNDVMSGIIVSDSEPLSLKDLVICNKWDYSIETGKCRSIGVYRECIKPGTKIQFTITIDRKIIPYSIEEIKEAIEAFANTSYNNFIQYFGKCARPEKNTVWLGGGVGFLSKTVIYPMYSRAGVKIAQTIFKNTKVPKKHKHVKDTEWGVSPHCLKMTKYKNKEYYFGECLINIEEATGG